jgi:DNA-directed RNA polymerase subunit RPC12/RpoP
MPDIFFNCWSCGKTLVVDEAGAGIEIDCPNCHHLVVIPQTTPQPQSATSSNQDSSQSGSGPRKDTCTQKLKVLTLMPLMGCEVRKDIRDEKPVAEGKNCPSCGRVVEADANYCRHCGLSQTAGVVAHASPSIDTTPPNPVSEETLYGQVLNAMVPFVSGVLDSMSQDNPPAGQYISLMKEDIVDYEHVNLVYQEFLKWDDSQKPPRETLFGGLAPKPDYSRAAIVNGGTLGRTQSMMKVVERFFGRLDIDNLVVPVVEYLQASISRLLNYRCFSE